MGHRAWGMGMGQGEKWRMETGDRRMENGERKQSPIANIEYQTKNKKQESKTRSSLFEH
jgi:hypothetical protein